MGSAPSAGQSKVDFVHEILRARIVNSEYAAGQRLIIDTLSKEVGVSQAPIREALRRLEAEGLVDYGANAGPSIVRLDKQDWFNLMEMKAVIEAYATRAAVPFITADDITELRSLNTRLSQALEAFDLESWSAHNRAFHELIRSRCPNQRMVGELEDLSQWADTVSRLVFSHERGFIIQVLGLSAGRETIAAHEQILDAVERGAADGALEDLSRAHTLALVKQVQDRLRANEVA
ncbi:DNA-binding GntR family transcriptional regulator [Actinokineospora baliensis]|uniref:GntR family transcriptional regulator n=1 Tax=Actinokineospora baliensis TaxID=547056 RepID=UPI0019599F7A|nr:GntR family transcriptional regulator [Actinokineospora baliensis]MBM7774077.1 DNA-binding GntR family transcriptional regulator [Actinokineospora baliensis]